MRVCILSLLRINIWEVQEGFIGLRVQDSVLIGGEGFRVEGLGLRVSSFGFMVGGWQYYPKTQDRKP